MMIEWWLDDSGKLIVVIQCWFIDNFDFNIGVLLLKNVGQVFVVFCVVQLDDGFFCVVGYVDVLVNLNVNDFVCKFVDDNVGDFGCGYMELMWVGMKGLKVGMFSNYLLDCFKVE